MARSFVLDIRYHTPGGIASYGAVLDKYFMPFFHLSGQGGVIYAALSLFEGGEITLLGKWRYGSPGVSVDAVARRAARLAYRFGWRSGLYHPYRDLTPTGRTRKFRWGGRRRFR